MKTQLETMYFQLYILILIFESCAEILKYPVMIALKTWTITHNIMLLLEIVFHLSAAKFNIRSDKQTKYIH